MSYFIALAQLGPLFYELNGLATLYVAIFQFYALKRTIIGINRYELRDFIGAIVRFLCCYLPPATVYGSITL